MAEESKKIDSTLIESMIKKTGYILEMEVAEILKKKGYEVGLNKKFIDLETNKLREIDIVARKEIGSKGINLIIECKKSEKDVWVFVCSDASAMRTATAFKHLPSLQRSQPKNGKKQSILEVFGHFHTFNKDAVPFAINSIIFDRYSEKKSTSLQIEESIEKLPKALLDVATKKIKMAEIFFPITVFSGQFFSVAYNEGIITKEENLVVVPTEVESKSYTVFPSYQDDHEYTPYEDRSRRIREVFEEMTKWFHIIFLTKNAFEGYLNLIEVDVDRIPSNDNQPAISEK